MGVAEFFTSLFITSRNEKMIHPDSHSSVEHECQILRCRVRELENRIKQAAEDRAVMESTIAIGDSQLAALRNELKQVEELRLRKQDIDQRFEQLEKLKNKSLYLRLQHIRERHRTRICRDMPDFPLVVF